MNHPGQNLGTTAMDTEESLYFFFCKKVNMWCMLVCVCAYAHARMYMYVLRIHVCKLALAGEWVSHRDKLGDYCSHPGRDYGNLGSGIIETLFRILWTFPDDLASPWQPLLSMKIVNDRGPWVSSWPAGIVQTASVWHFLLCLVGVQAENSPLAAGLSCLSNSVFMRLLVCVKL